MTFRVTILLVAALLLSSCSIYKMNIRQGNLVEQKDIDLIQKGMSKAQIEFILGRPLVDDPFASDTWYYTSTFKNGRTNEESQKNLVIKFVDDRVVNLEGDFTIPEAFDTQANQTQPN